MNKYLKYLVSILVCLTAGGIGIFFTIPSIPTWYAALIKPVFSPPNFLFAPVWTILYILMGISLALIWQKDLKTKRIRDAVFLFGVQLILNTSWSPIFFGARNLLLALIIIILMWIFILRTILSFRKINRIASYLLIPYLAWVSFATVLNFSLWILNK